MESQNPRGLFNVGKSRWTPDLWVKMILEDRHPRYELDGMNLWNQSRRTSPCHPPLVSLTSPAECGFSQGFTGFYP